MQFLEEHFYTLVHAYSICEYEVGWTPELVRNGEIHILDPTGNRTPTPRHVAHSQSLYRTFYGFSSMLSVAAIIECYNISTLRVNLPNLHPVPPGPQSDINEADPHKNPLTESLNMPKITSTCPLPQ
jgi:hypothetical protein